MLDDRQAAPVPVRTKLYTPFNGDIPVIHPGALAAHPQQASLLDRRMRENTHAGPAFLDQRTLIFLLVGSVGPESTTTASEECSKPSV